LSGRTGIATAAMARATSIAKGPPASWFEVRQLAALVERERLRRTRVCRLLDTTHAQRELLGIANHHGVTGRLRRLYGNLVIDIPVTSCPSRLVFISIFWCVTSPALNVRVSLIGVSAGFGASSRATELQQELRGRESSRPSTIRLVEISSWNYVLLVNARNIRSSVAMARGIYALCSPIAKRPGRAYGLYEILQTRFPPSSVTSSDPSPATATPTGRPQMRRSSSPSIHPVAKSS